MIENKLWAMYCSENTVYNCLYITQWQKCRHELAKEQNCKGVSPEFTEDMPWALHWTSSDMFLDLWTEERSYLQARGVTQRLFLHLNMYIDVVPRYPV